MSSRRLLLLVAVVAALAAGGTTIALAVGGGPVPPSKPLAVAVHDALAAPAPAGLTARIEFTNHLIDSSMVQSGNPLLDGATGRLWVAPGHHMRLELQSDRGDTQLVADGTTAWLYDASSDTVFRTDLRQNRDAKSHAADQDAGTPALAEIERAIARLSEHVDVSGAQPSDVAGRAA